RLGELAAERDERVEAGEFVVSRRCAFAVPGVAVRLAQYAIGTEAHHPTSLFASYSSMRCFAGKKTALRMASDVGMYGPLSSWETAARIAYSSASRSLIWRCCKSTRAFVVAACWANIALKMSPTSGENGTSSAAVTGSPP